MVNANYIKRIFLIKGSVSKHSVDARQINNKTYMNFDMEETAFRVNHTQGSYQRHRVATVNICRNTDYIQTIYRLYKEYRLAIKKPDFWPKRYSEYLGSLNIYRVNY